MKQLGIKEGKLNKLRAWQIQDYHDSQVLDSFGREGSDGHWK